MPFVLSSSAGSIEKSNNTREDISVSVNASAGSPKFAGGGGGWHISEIDHKSVIILLADNVNELDKKESFLMVKFLEVCITFYSLLLCLEFVECRLYRQDINYDNFK